MPKTRVVVVDDSALIRSLLREIIDRQPDMQCVGVAADPFAARETIRATDPDVLTLDVEMPRMDGIDFLAKLMRLRPMPVVMVSSHTQAGAEVTLEALALGAVDYVTKPRSDDSLADCAAELTRKVKAAARVPAATLERVLRPVPERLSSRRGPDPPAVIAVGASTGGPQALRSILSRLPAEAPPLLVAQHLPASFSESFVRRLAECTRMQVRQAAHGLALEPGTVYVAPGDHHLGLMAGRERLITLLDSGPKIGGHRPSVNFLFESVARAARERGMGVLLTGMGEDGASGLGAIRRAGGRALAQDQETSVVWGMPGEAVARGAVDHVLALEDLPAAMMGLP